MKTVERREVAADSMPDEPQRVERGHSLALVAAGWLPEWGTVQRRALRLGRTGGPALLALAILIALWQWYAAQPEIDPQFLPTAVWAALVAQRDILWGHTLVTLWETAVGFAAALAAGVAFATVIDFSPWLRRALYPLLVTSQTVPIITLAPLLVLWFGFGLLS